MKHYLISLLLVNFFILLTFSSFKNDNASKQLQEVIENGFYMNEGCTKVDSITCYGYEGFSYIHKITSTMLAYDRITYKFAVVSIEDGIFEKDIIEIVEGKIFNSVVGEKPMVRISLFNNIEYTRRKKTLNNAYCTVTMYGSTISGYEETWNQGTNSFQKKPIYQKTTILYDKIPLKNRKYIKSSPLQYVPIIGFFVKDKPLPEIVKSKDCYPCLGEKPEIFEFNPGRY